MLPPSPSHGSPTLCPVSQSHFHIVPSTERLTAWTLSCKNTKFHIASLCPSNLCFGVGPLACAADKGFLRVCLVKNLAAISRYRKTSGFNGWRSIMGVTVHQFSPGCLQSLAWKTSQVPVAILTAFRKS